MTWQWSGGSASGRTDNFRSILANMILHVVVDGVADSSLGVGLDVVGSAARLTHAGLTSVPRGTKALRQRVVSLDGRPVRSGAGRTVAVDGAFSLRGLGRDDAVVVPGMFAAEPLNIFAQTLLNVPHQILLINEPLRSTLYLNKPGDVF